MRQSRHTESSVRATGRACLREGLVKGRELILQHTKGPPVRSNVMHGQQKNMILLGHFQESRAENGPVQKIDGLPGFLHGQALASSSRWGWGNALRSTVPA